MLAGLFLGERLAPLQWLGVFVTVGGVGWVLMERNPQEQVQADRKRHVRGILLGLGAATGQAVGLILSKIGLGADFSPLSADLMRVLVAATAIWFVALLQRQARPTFEKVRQDSATLRATIFGAFFGPFIGVWLSLFAVQRTAIGVASTLIALPSRLPGSDQSLLLSRTHRLAGHRRDDCRLRGSRSALSGIDPADWRGMHSELPGNLLPVPPPRSIHSPGRAGPRQQVTRSPCSRL